MAPAQVDVAVVGGGLAGLATAYYLLPPAPAGRAHSVVVLEQAARPGGKVVTARDGGFVIEGGPDSFITQKADAYTLCQELGLGDQLIGTNDARRKTYVLAGGRLHRLPEGLLLIVPTRAGPLLRSGLFSPAGKLRLALDLLLPCRRATGDESLAAFAGRRLGQEAVDKLVTPLLAGIYTGDPAGLSLQATFPQLAELERRQRSLILGMRARQREAPAAPAAAAGRPTSTFLALRDGMQGLVDALAAHLGPEVIRTGRQVASLARDTGGRYRLHLTDGTTVTAAQVVLATPAAVAAALVAPLDAALAAGLRAIRTVSSATISLGYRAADLARPLDGFGFVVAAREPTPLLACTWTSSKFDHRAPPEHVLLRAFVGGARDEARAALPDAELVRQVRAELARLLGIRAAPVLTRIYRWPAANPQYAVGHLDRVAQLEARAAQAMPGLFLTGSAYRGVGLPDCIKNARQTAAQVTRSQATPG
ncbi:MAG TPA: protoporphyrinogen oxidase [Chloroflexia bacterium]|nr:protoporphyrinogen oxidase [Chloroflexia bacterium]